MDLHRHAALQRHWRRSPPLQLMVQGYLGIQPQEAPAAVAPQSDDAALQSFIRNFAAAGGAIH